MKQYFSVFTHQHIALNISLFLTILSLILPIASTAGNETNTADELISLAVKDEPLRDVFKKVSMATGYEISLDNKWQSYRVTASLEEVSLHKGLRQILRNLNNVIIYGSSKKIKIIIYDKTAPEGVSSAPSTNKSFDRAPVSRRRPHHPPMTQLFSSQDLGKEDGSENEEEPSDKSDVSGQESETSPPLIEGEEKIKSKKLKIEANEGANTDSQEKSSEESSEQDNQTESTSGGKTENSEGAESTYNTQ
jgi:hypothetical protein